MRWVCAALMVVCGTACAATHDDVAIVEGDAATTTQDVAALDRALPDVLPLDATTADRAVADVIALDLARPSPDVPSPLDVPPAMDVVTCSLPSPAARPPATGPDGSAVAREVAAQRPDWLAASCVSMGGTSAFLTEVLRRLRARDPRWGVDRSVGGITSDVVLYFYGDGCPEGRTEVYKFDVIARHCGIPGRDAPPEPAWFDRTSEGGVWTLEGFDPAADAGAPRPDVVTPRDVGVAPRPLPDGSAVVRAVASERPDLLARSCVTSGGNNDFLFEVVRRLRRMDTRWGLNWKRGNVGDMSQDVVDYYFGPNSTPTESSTDVYIVDIIGGHCGTSPSAAWTDVTEATRMGGTIGRWTLAGRTDLGP